MYNFALFCLSLLLCNGNSLSSSDFHNKSARRIYGYFTGELIASN